MANNAFLASKIRARETDPKIRGLLLSATAVLGCVGVFEKGPVGEAVTVTSFEEFTNIFGGYTSDTKDYVAAVQGWFDNGGTTLVVSRTVHFTDPAVKATKTSSKSSLNLLTEGVAADSGTVLGTVVGPFDIEPGDTLVVDVDSNPTATATFTATAAYRENTGTAPYNLLADGSTITVSVDGGAVQTVTFNAGTEIALITSVSNAELAAAINAQLTNGRAIVSGGFVRIVSDRRGMSSTVNVTGGTANGTLLFATGTGGTGTGTGNVSNIDSVSVAEVKAVVEAAVTGLTVTNDGGAVRLTSNTTGVTSQIHVLASSTADDELGLSNTADFGSATVPVTTLTAQGKYDGTYGQNITFKTLAASSGSANEFNIQVLVNGVPTELFVNLSMDTDEARYALTIVNDENTGSKWIELVDPSPSSTPTVDDLPAFSNVAIGPMTGGSNGLSSIDDNDFIGAPYTAGPGGSGIRAFDLNEEMTLLIVPGKSGASAGEIHNAMVSYCENYTQGRVFPVLDTPAGLSKTQVITYFETTASLLETSEHGAFYWSRVKVRNPSRSVFGSASSITVPPSGHIAGVYARNDTNVAGVHQPPAGVDLRLIGVIGVENEEVLLEENRDLIYPKRINPITKLSGFGGYFLDGSRTLRSSGSFPYINERRSASFCTREIKKLLQRYRHKGNTPDSRNNANDEIDSFLRKETNKGAFASRDPSLAYYTDVGDAINPPSVAAAGEIHVRFGIATTKPGEFIDIEVSQDTRALEQELA